MSKKEKGSPGPRRRPRPAESRAAQAVGLALQPLRPGELARSPAQARSGPGETIRKTRGTGVSTAWPERLDDLPVEMAKALGEASRMIKAVMRDPAVWVEEAGRANPTPLPWPVVSSGQGLPALLRWLLKAQVATALDAAAATHAKEPDRYPRPPPESENSPDFQTILRVCKRAVDAGAVVLEPYWEGTGRVDGWELALSWIKQHCLNIEISRGATLGEAFARVGMSKSSAYRALNRRPSQER